MSLTSANRILTAGATDTYTVTILMQINQGGPASNDICASPSVVEAACTTASPDPAAAGNPTFTGGPPQHSPRRYG